MKMKNIAAITAAIGMLATVSVQSQQSYNQATRILRGEVVDLGCQLEQPGAQTRSQFQQGDRNFRSQTQIENQESQWSRTSSRVDDQGGSFEASTSDRGAFDNQWYTIRDIDGGQSALGRSESRSEARYGESQRLSQDQEVENRTFYSDRNASDRSVTQRMGSERLYDQTEWRDEDLSKIDPTYYDSKAPHRSNAWHGQDYVMDSDWDHSAQIEPNYGGDTMDQDTYVSSDVDLDADRSEFRTQSDMEVTAREDDEFEAVGGTQSGTTSGRVEYNTEKDQYKTSGKTSQPDTMGSRTYETESRRETGNQGFTRTETQTGRISQICVDSDLPLAIQGEDGQWYFLINENRDLKKELAPSASQPITVRGEVQTIGNVHFLRNAEILSNPNQNVK